MPFPQFFTRYLLYAVDGTDNFHVFTQNQYLMKSFTKQSFFALATLALLSSCSRPYATFQKSTPEHFYTKAPATPAETDLVVAENPVTTETAAADVLVPAAPADVEAGLQQVDALVSTKAGLSTNKKLTRHLNRVKEMVSEVRTRVSAPTLATGTKATSVAPQKMNLVQRLVAKSIDKKIQHKLAPKKTMARSLLSIGIIIALIGVLLLLVGTGTVYSLGYVGLIVGIILIIASLL